jgi:hypothetical protein
MKPSVQLSVLVYIIGDEVLLDDAIRDMEEMRSVGSDSHINVVVQFDNSKKNTTTRYHIQKHGKDEQTWELDKVDSGSPETLLGFLQWAVREFPAIQYALILSSHGTGWQPEDFPGKVEPLSSVERNSNLLGKTYFKSSTRRILSSDKASRAIAIHNDTGHSIDTLELDKVLKQITQFLGRRLDLVGFDACLMSNLELIYQIRERARYLVLSANKQFGGGWPYDHILSFAHQSIVENGLLDVRQWAVEIVRSFDQQMQMILKQKEMSYPYTLIALDPGKISQVLDPLSTLTQSLLNVPDQQLKQIWKISMAAYNYDKDRYLYDLAHLCHKIMSNWIIKLTVDEDIRQAARKVFDAFIQDKENFVIARSVQLPRLKDTGGVSIFFMQPNDAKLSDSYAELPFSQQTDWLDFLKKYADLGKK